MMMAAAVLENMRSDMYEVEEHILALMFESIHQLTLQLALLIQRRKLLLVLIMT